MCFQIFKKSIFFLLSIVASILEIVWDDFENLIKTCVYQIFE